MSRSGKIIISVIAVAALLLLSMAGWFSSTYNGFVSQKEGIEAQWGNVQVQYQRRADLVPQLVATVSGAADFEQETILEATKARTDWLNTQGEAGTRAEEIAAASALDSALSRLLVTVESYPAVTATQNFQGLQAQLEGTENRVAVERRKYNETVRPYNTSVKQFPGIIVANMFDFDPEAFFEASEGSETAPEVNFNE